MCGITGFLETTKRVDLPSIKSTLIRMTETLQHRGPDDQGTWIDIEAGIALGHRRLSIIDLSSQGHQPMHSTCGQFVISFNGEIYNHFEIRKELEDTGKTLIWNGHSDTEIMLAAISHWGLETAVKKFSGMFAFALWDRGEKILSLVRDRIGEKPLYYGWVDKTFLFGSELKAFRVYPGWKGEINRDALALYMRYNCIPAPFSIFKNIYKLNPGTMVSIDVGKQPLQVENSSSSPLSPVYYWSAKEKAETGQYNSTPMDTIEATSALDKVLKNSIRKQMIADVPLGAFLSGGIDSSTVVALMQAQSTVPVKTFTIGFDEAEYNEAPYAKAVARQLGTEHTELYLKPRESLEIIPRLPTIYDEPFSDSSQIPTFLISQLASKHVKVCLSGDGGDELFGGYNRYLWGRRIGSLIRTLPGALRSGINHGIKSLSPMTWDYLFRNCALIIPKALRLKNPGDKLHKLVELLCSKNPEMMYQKMVSHWTTPEALVLDSKEPSTLHTLPNHNVDLKNFTQVMMYLDMLCYLPDDILVKVDRASMGTSLEGRVPFLDHKVVEFALKIPLQMKIKNGQGKWLLRQVLYKYIPKKLIDRPKMGFGVPIDSWLRKPLRDWAENLLNETRLREEGFFDPKLIQEKWREHLSGKKNWQYHLWDVLMFQAWLDNS